MAVYPNFVQCVPGQWTQICQLLPTRRGLIVSLIGGTAVLGVTTNAPSETTPFGTFPCGVLLSDQLLAGVARWRLSADLDPYLVQSAWYAWLPLPVPPVILMESEGQIPLVAGVNLLPYSTILIPPFLAYVLVLSANTGPTLATVSSLALGPLTAIKVLTLNDGATDSAIVGVFVYPLAGVSDTLTVTLAGTDTGIAVILLGQVSSLDANGSAAAAGTTLTLSTSAPIAQPVELAVAVAITLGATVTATVPVPWAQQTVISPVVSPDGSSWCLEVAGLVTSAVGVVSLNWDFGVGATDSTGYIFTAVGVVTPNQATIVAVIESFDVVIPPSPPIKFNVALPKLSPDAIKALNGLLAEMEQYNEAENAGIHQHGHSRHGGGGASQAESAP